MHAGKNHCNFLRKDLQLAKFDNDKNSLQVFQLIAGTY